MVKISIFGLAGTGTSTTAKEISKHLNLELIASGNMFRQIAKDKNLSLEEFSNLCLTNSEFDKELDRKIEKYGKENDNFVIDSRLAWHFIPDSIKIKLICDNEIRFQRVSIRDNLSLEDAKNKTLSRETTEKNRYNEYYQIQDYEKDENFNLIIDTTKTHVEDVCKIIENFLKEKNLI